MTKKKSSTTKPKKQEMSHDELRAFRHDVAVLKKKGLIAKTVDARKATPTRTLKNRIKEFQDVLKGEAKSWKVSKEMATKFKESGVRVINGHAVFDKKWTVNAKTGKVTSKDIFGGRATRIYGNSPSLPLYIDRIKNDPNMKLKKNEIYAFTFYGNNSWQAFKSLEDLEKRFEFYQTVQNAAKNPKEMQEVMNELIIIKLDEEQFHVNSANRTVHPRHGRKWEDFSKKKTPKKSAHDRAKGR